VAVASVIEAEVFVAGDSVVFAIVVVVHVAASGIVARLVVRAFDGIAVSAAVVVVVVAVAVIVASVAVAVLAVAVIVADVLWNVEVAFVIEVGIVERYLIFAVEGVFAYA
jgi:hypothetical protein